MPLKRRTRRRAPPVGGSETGDFSSEEDADDVSAPVEEGTAPAPIADVVAAARNLVENPGALPLAVRSAAKHLGVVVLRTLRA